MMDKEKVAVCSEPPYKIYKGDVITRQNLLMLNLAVRKLSGRL
jgi:hypothetical protein